MAFGHEKRTFTGLYRIRREENISSKGDYDNEHDNDNDNEIQAKLLRNR